MSSIDITQLVRKNNKRLDTDNYDSKDFVMKVLIDLPTTFKVQRSTGEVIDRDFFKVDILFVRLCENADIKFIGISQGLKEVLDFNLPYKYEHFLRIIRMGKIEVIHNSDIDEYLDDIKNGDVALNELLKED